MFFKTKIISPSQSSDVLTVQEHTNVLSSQSSYMTIAALLVGLLASFGAPKALADTITSTAGIPMNGVMVVTDSQVDIEIDDIDAFADAVQTASDTARTDAISQWLSDNPTVPDGMGGTRASTNDDVPQGVIDTAITIAIQPVIDNHLVGNSGLAACAQQLDGAITGLDTTSTALGLSGNIANLIGNAALVPPADQIAGIVGDSLGIAGDAVSFASIGTAGVQNSLPNCNSSFTGTIKAYTNILASQGISAFDGGIILGNDDITYEEGITIGGGKIAGAGKGGLDAFTGDKDAVAIGNGARAEKANDVALGTNAWANGGDSTAIGANTRAFGEKSTAIGAEAYAEGDFSTAIGAESHAEGLRSTALGYKADAQNEDDLALGVESIAAGGRSIAIGKEAQARGLDSLAIGSNSLVRGQNDVAVGANNKTNDLGGSNSILGNNNEVVTGSQNVLIGDGHKVTGDQNTAIGDPILIDGQKNFIAGNNTTVFGDDNVVIGNENTVGDINTDISNNIIIGDNNKNIETNNNNVLGDNNSITVGTGNNILGDDVTISGTRSLAIGQEVSVLESAAIGIGAGVRVSSGAEGAIATGRDSEIGANSKHSVVYGDNSQVADDAPDTTVIGSNSKGNAEKTTVIGSNAEATARGAAAFGHGAVATLTDQQVFGTSSNTYKTPGITSDKSRSRQIGRLQLTTTDAYGNLASDQGRTFRAIANLQAGVAIALASKAPSLPGDKNFGFRIGYGNFDGEATGVAASAIGVLCRDCFTQGDRLTLDASFGVGWAEYESYASDEVVSGQIGISWVW